MVACVARQPGVGRPGCFEWVVGGPTHWIKRYLPRGQARLDIGRWNVLGELFQERGRPSRWARSVWGSNSTS